MISQVNKSAKAIGAAISLGAASLTPTPANAALMAVGSIDQNYKDYGASFSANNQALWLKQTLKSDTSQIGYASATPINSNFAITSAHLASSLLNFEVGTGTNFYNDLGQTVSIVNVLGYPGYDGTRNTPDIAILQFGSPLLGLNTATIGSAYPGDILSTAGFG